MSGLLVSFEKGENLKFGDLNPIEEFEGLNLQIKYGFNLGWYIFAKVHVIKFVCKNESRIYIADNKVEIEPIINNLIAEVHEKFSVTEKDQKEMYNMLKNHGCCYF